MIARTPTLGLVAALAAVALLASACGDAGPESPSPQPSGEHRSGSRTPEADPPAPGDKIAKGHLTGQTGFTIRHLQDGHVEEIDVPDFKR